MNMNKKLIIISIVLMLVGVILAAIGFFAGGATSISLAGHGLTLDYGAPITINETMDDFQSIDLDLDYMSEVQLIESDHFGIEATYYNSNGTISYRVENGMLKVTQDKINHFIGFNFFQPSSTFTIHIPSGTSLDNITLNTDTANIVMEDQVATNIYIKNAFGKTTLENIETGVLELEVESGLINLDTVKAITLSVENDFGAINLRNIVSNNVDVAAESGSISVSDLTASNLIVSNDFGKTELKSITALVLDATNETGSIKITDSVVNSSNIENDFGSVEVNLNGNLADYNYNLMSDFGSVRVNGNKQGNTVTVNNGGSKNLSVKCESGSVIININ
ncbi:MAG TPA: hypothetical protein DCY20_03195 [Firmicutes bacterium]|nr:hypothetical protein [Bacillota bacterium]